MQRTEVGHISPWMLWIVVLPLAALGCGLCQPTAIAEATSPSGDYSIQMRKRWSDVQLEYLVGPRLMSLGAGDVLERYG